MMSGRPSSLLGEAPLLVNGQATIETIAASAHCASIEEASMLQGAGSLFQSCRPKGAQSMHIYFVAMSIPAQA